MVSGKLNKSQKSALIVNDGVQQPSSVNVEAISRLKTLRRNLNLEDYLGGILKGERSILSKAITLIESAHPEHQLIAQQLVANCLPYSGNSIRIGITGVPGAGKSTFIEAFGKLITAAGNKVAVLAVDPSSTVTKGSILGDKTRMEELSKDVNAFIRPSPSAGSLGGVARKTRETIILCEAAGFNVILVETVGVGQSETTVHSMVDFFLLLLLAGAGDELQGIKRGIMEMADVIVINKADGDNFANVNLALAQISNALRLFHPSDSGWKTEAVSCSALFGTGLNDLWILILRYFDFIKNNKFFEKQRIDQALDMMHQSINQALISRFYQDPHVKKRLKQLEVEIKEGRMSSFKAAQELLSTYHSGVK